MDFIKTYGKEIFSLLVPLVTFFLNYIFKGRVKIIFGDVNGFTYLINEPLLDDKKEIIKEKQLVHTKSVFLQNIGKESASRLEIVFNYRPMYFNVWPVRHYQEFNEGDGRYIIIFENLAPKDFMRIEVLSINHDLPAILSVKAKECVAKEVAFYPQMVINQYLKRFLMFLMMLGMAAFVYILIIVLQWLLIKTG
ncbi:hypothetical protein I4P15_03260 [Enterobacter roggenkampii]|nr:hypothetical protein [Enterobacter roggenkampii]